MRTGACEVWEVTQRDEMVAGSSTENRKVDGSTPSLATTLTCGNAVSKIEKQRLYCHGTATGAKRTERTHAVPVSDHAGHGQEAACIERRSGWTDAPPPPRGAGSGAWVTIPFSLRETSSISGASTSPTTWE